MRKGTEGKSYCSRVVPRFERRNSETEWTDWHRRSSTFEGKEGKLRSDGFEPTADLLLPSPMPQRKLLISTASLLISPWDT